MIVKKAKRKRAKFSRRDGAYMGRLNRYIVRADIEDLRKLGRHDDLGVWASDRQLAYITDVTSYTGGSGKPAETAVATGAINLFSDDMDGWQAEMQAHLHRSRGTEDLMEHFIVSWQGDDDPTERETEKVVQLFLQSMGYDDCACVWGKHQDTDNPHVHMGILRVNVVTGNAVKVAGDDWDIDRAHRAIAIIEDHFPHWDRNPKRLYDVRQGRLVRCVDNLDIGPAARPNHWASAATGRSAAKQIKLEKSSLDVEAETGLWCATRTALEIAVPIMRSATTWPDLHTRLAAEGIGIELSKYRSGANLKIGRTTVKASVHDATSLQKLETRLGSFEARPESCGMADFRARSLYPGDAQRQRYFEARCAHTARTKAALTELKNGHEGFWPSTQLAQTVNFPSFNDWTPGFTPPDPWTTLAAAHGAHGVMLAIASKPTPVSIPGYTPMVGKRSVSYWRTGHHGRPAFVDIGSRIFVNDDADDVIRAVLRVMAARSQGRPLEAFGSPAFIRTVEAIAAKEGIAIQRQSHDIARQTAQSVPPAKAKAAHSAPARPNAGQSKARPTEPVSKVTASAPSKAPSTESVENTPGARKEIPARTSDGRLGAPVRQPTIPPPDMGGIGS